MKNFCREWPVCCWNSILIIKWYQKTILYYYANSPQSYSISTASKLRIFNSEVILTHPKPDRSTPDSKKSRMPAGSREQIVSPNYLPALWPVQMNDRIKIESARHEGELVRSLRVSFSSHILPRVPLSSPLQFLLWVINHIPAWLVLTLRRAWKPERLRAFRGAVVLGESSFWRMPSGRR